MFTNETVNKLFNEEKADPGIFSLLEPGWWALHATAIAGIYLLGRKMRSRY